jgi:hypothetical protein
LDDICHDLRLNLILTLLQNLQRLKIILKYTALLILVLVTLLYNAGMTYSVLYYSLDNDAFTEKYCVNKEKPILKCNGKCELAKIAKATEKQNPEKNSITEKEYILFFQLPDNLEFTVFTTVHKSIVTKCKLHDFIVPETNFHPPKLRFSFS